MKKFVLPIIVLVIVIAILWRMPLRVLEATPSDIPEATATPTSTTKIGQEIVIQNLNIPWELVFLPAGEMLITERPGDLVKVSADGQKKTIPVPGVRHAGEGGLLGMALHPNFNSNHYLYLYLTTMVGGGTTNRVERYQFRNDELTDKKVIIHGIPGATYHDGGRIKFGPDGMFYITTGDASREQNAQDLNSLAGKILRLRDDGSVPADNPFDSLIWSYGHRNPQGLAWDDQGRLWATEHGRSGALSGFDELNLIKKGANYGWPTIQGDQQREGMETPVINSGATTTWAPSGLLFRDNKLYFTGLRGEALYEATITRDGRVSGLQQYFKTKYGRLRTITTDRDGAMYLLTNNTDGRGTPRSDDDKLIKISDFR